MRWLTQYESRLTTAEEAVRNIQSGQRVFLTGNCSVPQQILSALVNRAPELEDVEIAQVLNHRSCAPCRTRYGKIFSDQ